jgi:hypothetical protein
MARGDFGNKRNTNGLDKKPENINRKGQPRKLIGDVVNDLKSQGVIPASKTDIVDCYLQLIQLPKSDLEAKIKDNNQPSLVTIVGKAILSGKGFEVIEKVLDRGIGKADQKLDLSGEVNILNDTRKALDTFIDSIKPNEQAK